MDSHLHLGIETALESSEPTFFDKYRVMKERLLNVEYEHWAAGFPEGNNHGRGHIVRVLENLNHLLGSKPLEHLDPYELFLTMMSVLYHDIGLLQTRKGHENLSKSLLEGDRNDAYIVNSIDKEIIAAAVVSHSSSKDIAKEISRFSPEEIVGTHKARPGVVAALVRLADELDEDHRRADAILQQRLLLPSTSRFFWTFCQRIRGIRPNLVSKRIDFNVAFEPEDMATYGAMPNGQVRHFVVFSAEKFAKINDERVKVNRFLPPELQYGGIHIDVKPLRNHKTWDSPRTFVFNDYTTHSMFLQSFPELWEEPANDAMHSIRLMIKDGDLDEADARLNDIVKVIADLPVRTQLDIPYLQACVRCLQATSLQSGHPDREELLNQTVDRLADWFTRGQAEGFRATGRTVYSAVSTMAIDPDLAVVRSERRDKIRATIPDDYWPTPGGGSGCIPVGTLIDTPSGPVPIECLRPGHVLVSLNLEDGYKRVNRKVTVVSSMQSSSCVRLNESWLVTPTQPVRKAADWVEASNLKEGDSVVTGNGSFVSISALAVIDAPFEVFDLTTEGPDHNFIAAGLVCHNKQYK
jgi:hypothetical protein